MRPLVSKCDLRRTYGQSCHDKGCLDCSFEMMRAIARDLVVDLEISHAVSCFDALSSDVVLAGKLAENLASANGHVREMIIELMSRGRDQGFVRRDGSLARVIAFRIASARRLRREIPQVGRLALSVAAAVSRVRGVPRLPHGRYEADRLLSVFAAQDADRLDEASFRGKVVSSAAIKSASRMTYWATKVLPHDSRMRFGEEWSAELMNIAADNASRIVQVCYGLRVLLRSIQLRFALLWDPDAESMRDE
jgi:hypothetical protein